MSLVPVEIILAGNVNSAEVDAALTIANSSQEEFRFIMAEQELQLRMGMHSYLLAQANDLLDGVESLRSEVRGYHPFIIAITNTSIDGSRYSNLFGSHRARSGVAVITTSNVVDVIIPAGRMVAYFIYYLARYSLSFLSPAHLNHEDPRGCVFDRKVNKEDLQLSMRAHAFCDYCRRALVSGEGSLSPRQFSALNRLFGLSGNILSKGFESTGRARVFIGSSSEGLDIANKLQELLSSEFSVVVWNQGTVFGLGSSTLEALEAAVLEYASGIFVFTPDDELASRGQVRPVARDNVLFELGMFVGRLGRKKSFVLHPGHRAISLPSDLNGITLTQYNPSESDLAAALGAPVNQIRSAIRNSATT